MPSDRTAGVPLGMLGALVSIALVEWGLSRPSVEHASKVSLAWRFGAEAARSPEMAGDAGVLCLGDSLVKLGVQPRVLERSLGVRACNLAVPGAQAGASDFLLRRAIAAGARPRCLVVDFEPNLLAASPRSYLPHWANLLEPGEWLDLSARVGDGDFAFRLALNGLFASIRDRHGIRARIVADLNGRDRPERAELLGWWRNWRENRGGHVATPGDPVGVDSFASGDPTRARWKPHEVNAAYVRRLLRLAADHGIAVVWLVPPGRPDWRERRGLLGLDDDYDRFVAAEVAAATGTVVVIDGRDAGYPAGVFRDATHLDGRGAVALSAALAEAIRPILEGNTTAGARRVALRPFEDPGPAFVLEDVITSRALAAAVPSTVGR